jgi:hypothetical protein
MKKQFIFCLFIMCIINTYGQKVINGVIYTDTTMTKTITDVKIILKSKKSKKTIKMKTDINGSFTLLFGEFDTEYKVIIKKKNYIPLTIESFSIPRQFSELHIKLMLKKMLSLHDENYEGVSKIISVDQN